MQKDSLADRLRYRFDNFMARGTIALVAGLFVVSALLVIGVSVVVALAGWTPDVDPTVDLPGVVWLTLLSVLDPGSMGGGSGGGGFLAAMLLVTFGGIFLVSTLIGIINTGIAERLTDLRKGRSRVIEDGHTVILGWSQQVFAVAQELVLANANQRRARIVILAERDKVAMEDELRVRLPDTGGTRIVCRTGSSIDPHDLEIANIHASRSIIVLAPDSPDSDAHVIKTILAITNNPKRRPEPYQIVAEIRDSANVDAARMVGQAETSVIPGDELVARIIAQTSRQSGLSVVYSELLGFEGDEIYFAPTPPELVGTSFGDALLWFEDSALLGYVPGATGIPQLNPPGDALLSNSDVLIAISRDDDTVRAAAAQRPVAALDALVPPSIIPAKPERILVLGWNWRAIRVIRELDAYVAPSSSIEVVSDASRAERQVAHLQRGLQNLTVVLHRSDSTDRGVLEEIRPESFDHIIVLSEFEDGDAQRADSRTLITLLHLRQIATGRAAFSIVSEMMDDRNRALAEVTRPDDFIVSNRLVSLVLAQTSQTPALKAVFDELLSPAGADVHIRPASQYVSVGVPITFATIVEAARRRGEVAIGYRRQADSRSPDKAYGVVLNPRKTAEITLEALDRVVVLAAGPAPLLRSTG